MDDNRDKEMMRNQMIAIVLMTILFVVWFKFFMPAPQPKKPVPVTQQAQQEASEQAAKTKKAEEKAMIEQPPLEQSLWPELPAIPEVADPAAEEVALSSPDIEFVFTRVGARLKRAKLIKDDLQLVPTQDLSDTEAVYPLGLRFSDEGLGDALDYRRFEVENDAAGNGLTFRLTIPGRCAVEKTFSLGEQGRVLDVQVSLHNLGTQNAVFGMDQTPAYYLSWGPDVHSGDEGMGIGQSLMWYKEGRVDELATASMEPAADGSPFSKAIPGAEWMAVRSAYFVMAMKPEFEEAQGWAAGVAKRFRVGLSVPRFEMAPDATQTNAFRLYMGPSEQRALALAWPTLPKVFRFYAPPWEFMDWFAKLLLAILNWFHDYVIANYGWAIIFLTVVVRTVMYPLTLKSMKSMKKMQLLGPEIEALKAKYPDDAQEMNKKMMELYRERGVNPLGGCLPMLLQMPVFFALYRMLWSSYELRGAHFFGWVTDLSQPDHLMALPWMHQIPLIGTTFDHLNILPILMGIAMVVNQKFMPVSGPSQNPQQKMMMNIMPVFFSFLCYKMAAGLNLYILTSTVLGMVQQKFTRVGDMELKAKKAPAKRQHFYTAAQARKRQMAREAKKEKRHKSDS